MESPGKLKNFFRNFRTKVRISASDPHDGRERWYIFLSPLNMLAALVALLVVFFVVVVSVVAFTPALDLVPGYPGNKTRAMLIEYNIRLDSLENELALWNRYYDNLTRIMDGKPPEMEGLPDVDSAMLARGDVPRIPEDSVLRSQMTGPGPYALQSGSAGRSHDYPEFYPPVKGVVTAKFDPRAGRYGVDVAVAENQPVMAMMEGVVINAAWTPTEGSVIYILHLGNMISAYLHNASVTKKTGDRVYSGEVVAFTGTSISTSADQGYTEIQLWINGTPVDPENYMVF